MQIETRDREKEAQDRNRYNFLQPLFPTHIKWYYVLKKRNESLRAWYEMKAYGRDTKWKPTGMKTKRKPNGYKWKKNPTGWNGKEALRGEMKGKPYGVKWKRNPTGWNERKPYGLNGNESPMGQMELNEKKAKKATTKREAMDYDSGISLRAMKWN